MNGRIKSMYITIFMSKSKAEMKHFNTSLYIIQLTIRNFIEYKSNNYIRLTFFDVIFQSWKVNNFIVIEKCKC